MSYKATFYQFYQLHPCLPHIISLSLAGHETVHEGYLFHMGPTSDEGIDGEELKPGTGHDSKCGIHEPSLCIG